MRIKGVVMVLLSICILLLNSPVSAEETEELEFCFEEMDTIAQSDSIPPKILSPAAIAIDTLNGRILYNKNAFVKRQMASTTKMMTAILAIEKGNPEDEVVVSQRAAYVGGSQAHLKANEKIKMQDLLYALMLPSGNDAAIAIAEHIGGTVENFVEIMNQKAAALGAQNTKYGSPHGLDRDNYSTAYDLAVIAQYCIKNPTFAKVVSTKSKVIPRDKNAGGSEYHNTNDMLDSYQGADGIKTGYTGPAGRCLVTSATRNQWQVISVILGASSVNNRSNDTRKVLDYVFYNYPLVNLLKDNTEVTGVPVTRGKADKVKVMNKGEISAHLNHEEVLRLRREFNLPAQLTAPVQTGQKVGNITISLGDFGLGTSELYAGEKVNYWTVDMNIMKVLKHWLRFKLNFVKYNM